MKRFVLRIVVLLILLPLLVVGLQLLATRVINQDTVKKRIETAVSQELGGTLHYDEVRVAILPRPRIVIERPAVSIPGSLAGTSRFLDVNFDLLPLLFGKARIADVRLDQPDLTLVLTSAAPEDGPSDGSAPHRSLTAVLGWLAAKMPNLAIRIDQGRVVAIREEEEVFTLKDVAIRLSFAPPDAEAPDSGKTHAEPFLMTGRVRGVLTRSAGLPGPVRVRIDAFEARPYTVSFTDSEVQALDAAGTVSGRFDDYLTTRPAADFTIVGSIGPKMMQWIRTTTSLPEELLLRAPVSISSAHVALQSDGTARVKGSGSVQRDVSIGFNVQRSSDQFTVDELSVRDKDSQAAFTMDFRNRVLRLSFAGRLAHSTLARIFAQQRVEFGSLTGDFRTQIALDRPRDSTAQGRLEGDQLVLPLQTRIPVFIDRVVAQATAGTVSVDPLVITIGGIQHTVRGQISSDADQWLLDLNVDRLDWGTIEKFFGSKTAGSEPMESEPVRDAKTGQPVRATIRVSAASFTVGDWTAAPARADIAIGPEPPHITLHEAMVCGITVAGSATIAGDATRIAITSSAKGQDLEPTLTCLVGKPMRVTGTFDLSGKLDSTGAGKTLVDNLGGTVAFSVKGGRFYADSAVVRILSYLNLTELLRGAFPDPGSDGLPYKSVVVRSTTQQGRLVINEAVLTSSIAHMAATGSLDLRKHTSDVTVLVAPLTAVDAVVKRIPLVREILGGSLVSIPVRVTGPFDNPKVDAVPPAAVAEQLGGIMQRTLKLPFKIMAPVIPGGKKPKEGEG